MMIIVEKIIDLLDLYLPRRAGWVLRKVDRRG